MMMHVLHSYQPGLIIDDQARAHVVYMLMWGSCLQELEENGRHELAQKAWAKAVDIQIKGYH